MSLSEIRRRPTLPGRFQPSTISVLRLNFCVRDGNRWIPQAIVTGNMGLFGFPLRTLKTAQVGVPFRRLTKALSVTPRHSSTNHFFRGLGVRVSPVPGSASRAAFRLRSQPLLFPGPFSLFSKIKPSTD